MSDRRPYSRIYWSVLDDDKFEAIRGDMRHFGSWSLMLIVADMAYPSPAFIPPTVSKASLTALVDAGLVDLLPSRMYRIHGLRAEREARATAATREPKRDPVAPQAGPSWDPVGSQAKSEDKAVAEDKTSQGTDTARAPDPADAYWTLTGKYPNDKALGWIDDMASSYGPEPVLRAIAQAHLNDRSTASLLGRAQDLLRSEARALSLKDQAAVRATLKERRAEPRIEVDPDALRAEITRLMQPGAAA